MSNREKLVELLMQKGFGLEGASIASDHLIAHGVTVQKWIPVSEPPKERGEYLCYFKFEPESPDVVCDNTYRGSGRWMSETDKVTHWMPLPEAPICGSGSY